MNSENENYRANPGSLAGQHQLKKPSSTPALSRLQPLHSNAAVSTKSAAAVVLVNAHGSTLEPAGLLSQHDPQSSSIKQMHKSCSVSAVPLGSFTPTANNPLGNTSQQSALATGVHGAEKFQERHAFGDVESALTPSGGSRDAPAAREDTPDASLVAGVPTPVHYDVDHPSTVHKARRSLEHCPQS